MRENDFSEALFEDASEGGANDAGIWHEGYFTERGEIGHRGITENWGGWDGRDNWGFWLFCGGVILRFVGDDWVGFGGLIWLVMNKVFEVFVANCIANIGLVGGVIFDFWGWNIKWRTRFEFFDVIVSGRRTVFVDVVNCDGRFGGFWWVWFVDDDIGLVLVAHSAKDSFNIWCVISDVW